MLRCVRSGSVAIAATLGVLLCPVAGAALAGELPAILSTDNNQVPPCVTPQALMDFVHQRNERHQPRLTIEPKFEKVAALYQSIGSCVGRAPEKCVGVRWDYAFFQMLTETAYLTFRRADGAIAAVPPGDNNFAGLGATVSGRRGEDFRDVETGVLAHLQHVLMYSTTRIPAPVARRTRDVQGDVQPIMARLRRPVTFDDLATQWVGSGHSSYSRTIAAVAERFRAQYCSPAKVAAR